VYIGCHTCILGPVHVGDGAKIGAGSVVVQSVPPGATVVGVPGHVIAYTNTTNDTVERLPDPEWDRLHAMEARVEDLEHRLADTQSRLDEVTRRPIATTPEN
jgi:serine O-acetyltransferase